MSQIKFLLLSTALSCLSLHCKKEEPSEMSKLPPITNYGAQTFGCLINGKAWPTELGFQSTDYYMGSLTVDYHTTYPDFSLKESVYLYVDQNFFKEGDYTINFNQGVSINTIVKINGKTYWDHDPINQLGFAHLTISRLDTVNHYISGTFNFTLYSADGKSKVEIENGRFDYKYH